MVRAARHRSEPRGRKSFRPRARRAAGRLKEGVGVRAARLVSAEVRGEQTFNVRQAFGEPLHLGLIAGSVSMDLSAERIAC